MKIFELLNLLIRENDDQIIEKITNGSILNITIVRYFFLIYLI